MKRQEAGYTLVELLVCVVVLAVLSLGAFQLFTSLLHSAIVAQRQAVASTLATNQMEYLKSLPYDSLAIAGGPILSTTTIPGTITKTVQGGKYTVRTTINYADDAYDGCGSYTPANLAQTYCRSYPPPTGATTDTNPGDYKDVRVTVTDISGTQLASLNTHIAALVAETASNTGAVFVRVIDDSGNPINGASVNIVNTFTSPAVNLNNNTDQNGIAIFYGLPPSSTGNRYVITASNSGYSTLTTIAPSGSLQPTYLSQNLITQSSSSVTLTLKPMGANSLVIEATNETGTPINQAKIYVKGGYKRYIDINDTSYYYETPATPTPDKRPVTDASGLVSLTNLVPGSYFFCDNSVTANSCTVGAGTTRYYVAAAVPYGGDHPLQPIVVPIYDPNNPPTTTFTYNSVEYLQKVRLMLTTSTSFPRITSIAPGTASIANDSLSSFAFTLTGTNLCTPTSGNCSSINIRFTQASNTFTASCSGTHTSLSCTTNLSAAVAGNTQLVITSGSNTLTLPGAPLLGGILVIP